MLPIAIPRVIMQTWKTKTIPKHWEATQHAIKKHMSHWDYHLMTDEDNLKFVKKYFPDFLNIFNSFEYPIQRADAIRYMWLYVNGGIYLDLDLEIVKPMDDLFLDKNVDLFVIKSGTVKGTYTNAFMASKPRLHVMLECLRLMQVGHRPWHIGKHLKVINSTGPNMFTTSIITEKAFAESQGHHFEVLELPSELIIACSICEPKPCHRPGAYCRTLGGSSWSGNDTELLTILYCRRRELAISISIVVILIILSILMIIKKKK